MKLNPFSYHLLLAIGLFTLSINGAYANPNSVKDSIQAQDSTKIPSVFRITPMPPFRMLRGHNIPPKQASPINHSDDSLITTPERTISFTEKASPKIEKANPVALPINNPQPKLPTIIHKISEQVILTTEKNINFNEQTPQIEQSPARPPIKNTPPKQPITTQKVVDKKTSLTPEKNINFNTTAPKVEKTPIRLPESTPPQPKQPTTIHNTSEQEVLITTKNIKPSEVAKAQPSASQPKGLTTPEKVLLSKLTNIDNQAPANEDMVKLFAKVQQAQWVNVPNDYKQQIAFDRKSFQSDGVNVNVLVKHDEVYCNSHFRTNTCTQYNEMRADCKLGRLATDRYYQFDIQQNFVGAQIVNGKLFYPNAKGANEDLLIYICRWNRKLLHIDD